jgi:hypothetical protein
MDDATKLLLENILDQIKENRDAVGNDIALQATAISGRVDAKMEEKLGDIKGDIGKLLSHNDKQNGWIKDHTDRLEKLDGEEGVIDMLQGESMACAAHRGHVKKFSKNWKWVVAATILGFFILHSVFEVVNLKTIIDWVVKLIF